MTPLSVIGSGNVGPAISAIAMIGGNTVDLTDQSTTDRPSPGTSSFSPSPTARSRMADAAGEKFSWARGFGIRN